VGGRAVMMGVAMRRELSPLRCVSVRSLCCDKSASFPSRCSSLPSGADTGEEGRVREKSLLVSSAFVVAAAFASCGGTTETELFGAPMDGAPAIDASDGPSPSASSPSNAELAARASGVSVTPGAEEDAGEVDPVGPDAGADAGIDADAAVAPGAFPCEPPCNANQFCKLPTCEATSGTCVNRPLAPALGYNPHCGCDGITYWTPQVAAFDGVSVAAPGECPVPVAKRCAAGFPCPGEAKCNHDQGKKAQCNLRPEGSCWRLPATCPDKQGGCARPCSDKTASSSLCAAIRTESAFFKIASCP